MNIRTFHPKKNLFECISLFQMCFSNGEKRRGASLLFSTTNETKPDSFWVFLRASYEFHGYQVKLGFGRNLIKMDNGRDGCEPNTWVYFTMGFHRRTNILWYGIHEFRRNYTKSPNYAMRRKHTIHDIQKSLIKKSFDVEAFLTQTTSKHSTKTPFQTP